MKLILPIDIDESKIVEFCMMNLCDKAYKKKIKERLTTFCKLKTKTADLANLTYTDEEAPVQFYTGGQSLNSFLYKISPLTIQQAKPLTVNNEPSEILIVEDCSQDAGPAMPVSDLECIISTTGLFYKSFHNSSFDDIIISASVPIGALAKLLGVSIQWEP